MDINIKIMKNYLLALLIAAVQLGLAGCDKNIPEKDNAKQVVDLNVKSVPAATEMEINHLVLKSKAFDLNSKCRGESPSDETDRICLERDTIYKNLENIGWCWGVSSQPNSSKTEWVSCKGNKNIENEKQVLLKSKKNNTEEITELGNFLIGLCEIPPESDLNECSVNNRQSSEVIVAYSFFTSNQLNFVIRDKLSIPKELRKIHDYSTNIKYILGAAPNTVITLVTGTQGECTFKSSYTKNGETIKVITLGATGNCSRLQLSLLDRQLQKYDMKYRKYP